jgi:hypothetical protein
VINPTTKLRFFLEKILAIERLIFILYNTKKIDFKNSLK